MPEWQGLHLLAQLERASKGRTKHRAKECTAGKGDGSPDRSPAGQLAKATTPTPPSGASVARTIATVKDMGHLNGVSLGALSPGDQWSSVWPMGLIVDLAGAVPSEDDEAALDQLCKFDAASWRLHLQRDHLPYRRDCRVCVERASGRPHRKISHPSAYSLAADLVGPFRVTGAGGYKYLMVRCYRFPKLSGITDVAVEDKEEVAVPVPEDGKDWIMTDEERPPDEAGGAIPDEAAKHEVVIPNVPEDGDKDHDEEIEKLKELAKPLEFASIYLVRPMKSRKKKDALRAVQELYVQLRSHGLPVCKLHSDRARELQTNALDAWAAARDIEVTKTQGSDLPGPSKDCSWRPPCLH